MFTVKSQGTELEFLTDAEYSKLETAFSEHYTFSNTESILRARHSVTFIREYNRESVMVSYISFSSLLFCIISPAVFQSTA